LLAGNYLNQSEVKSFDEEGDGMNQVIKEHTFSTGQKVQLVQGDITDETVDAIVNAANSHLAHGAGVAGAIARRGGRTIQLESDQWVLEHGPVSHAQPAYTGAGSLPCKYVIHAVGPVWGEGDEQAKLEQAVNGSLERAEQLGLGSMAFPAISTGIFGFPTGLAAQVMFSAIEGYIEHNPSSSLKLVRIVLYDRQTVLTFVQEWEKDDLFGA
jgi:O-acetyl-ADP-ribose deacetylase (regulator of RNase III)